MNFVSEIVLHKNKQRPADLVYTDFKSAYEAVFHDLRMSSLPAKAVGPRITRWTSHFIDGRSSRVRANGSLSRTGFLTDGCSQRTVSISHLFPLFVDEIKHTKSKNDKEVLVYKERNGVLERSESFVPLDFI